MDYLYGRQLYPHSRTFEVDGESQVVSPEFETTVELPDWMNAQEADEWVENGGLEDHGIKA